MHVLEFHEVGSYGDAVGEVRGERCKPAYTDEPFHVRAAFLAHISVAKAPLGWRNETWTYLTLRRLNLL